MSGVYPDVIVGVLDVLSRHERAAAFCLAFACMLCQGACAEPERRGTREGDASLGKGDAKGAATAVRWLAVCLSAACGALRPFAWLVFYPHPTFPVPVPDVFLGFEDLWISTMPCMLFVPMVAVSALSLGLVKKGSGFLPYIVAGFAMGELGMRALERLVPEILGVPLWVSLVCLAIQVACIVAVCVLVMRAGRLVREEPAVPVMGFGDVAEPNGTPAPAEVTREALVSCISLRDAEVLADAGLTPGEVNAVRAAVLGLDSTRAAGLLRLQPSTIRTYRRRVCTKLGLGTIDDLAADLVRRRGLFAEGQGGRCAEEPETMRFVHSVALGDSDGVPCGWRRLFGLMRTAVAGEFEAATGGTLCRGNRQNTRADIPSGSHLGGTVGVVPHCAPAVLQLVGCLGGLLCVLLPYGGAAGVWDALFVAAAGVGLGLLLASGWLAVCRVFPRFRVLSETFLVRGLSFTGATLSVTALVTMHMADVRAVLDSFLGALCWALALGVFVSYGIVGLVWAKRHVGGCHQFATLASVGAASLLAALACLGGATWAAVFVACAACMLGGGRARRAVCGHAGFAQVSRVSDNRVAGESSRGTMTLLILCAFIGFAWEEVWRGQVYVSFQTACLPACIAVLVVMAWAIRRRLTWWFCASMAGSGLVVAFAMGPCAASVMCILCLAVLHACTDRPADDGTDGRAGGASGAQGRPRACASGPAPLLPAIACGIGIGVYAVNTFGSYLLRQGSPYGAYRLILTASTWALLAVLTAVVLLCLLWALRNRRLRQAAESLSLSASPERLRAFLLGKGFDETRADLVALLAEGSSVTDAAWQLGYSRSTVDRMRREAFAALGVSTRMQLVSYLANEFHKTPGK